MPKSAEPEAPRRRGGTGKLILGIILGAGVGSGVFFGWRNYTTYQLRCEGDKLVSDQGLPFPVGRRQLPDPAHAPIAVPPTLCKSRTFAVVEDLNDALIQVLIRGAEQDLGDLEKDKVAAAEKRIEQAKLLAQGRPPYGAKLEHLAGDLAFRRARATYLRIEADLKLAREQFVLAKKNRSQFADVDGWIRRIDQVLAMLGTQRPAGSPPSPAPAAPSPSAPAPAAPAPATPAPPPASPTPPAPAPAPAAPSPLPSTAPAPETGGGQLL
jgi:hypothetical protein